MNRVIFYFDGFNFYNGLRDKSEINSRWKNYYWLDFVKFCSQFIDDDHELKAIKYFTAPPSNDGKRSRQSALFSANKLLNKELFQVINGQFQNRTIICRSHCGNRFLLQEEKTTDVSIAVNMIMDCYENNADTLVLVSADSDQVPTIKAIKAKFPDKKLKVYFPPERNSTELFSICKPIVYLSDNEDKFRDSVMPNEVSNEKKKYIRPEKWRG